MKAANAWVVLGITTVAWVFFFLDVRVAGLLGVVAYLVLAVLIVWPAVRYRRAGWAWGALLGLLLLTLPWWVIGGARLVGLWLK